MRFEMRGIDTSLFWVLQIIFGFLIARTPFLYQEVIFSPVTFYMPAFALVVAYMVTLWSWIDFSQILTTKAYDRYDRNDMFRFIVDLGIVMAYMLLFISIQNFERNEPILNYLLWFPVIFIGYVLSGYSRIKKYGSNASRINLLNKYMSFYILLFGFYFFTHSWFFNQAHPMVVNTLFIILFGGVYISYRMARRRVRKRNAEGKKENGLTIGIDIDGVLANQIDIILPIINAKYHKELTYEDITDWELKIDNTDIAQLIVEFQKNESIILGMDLHKGAKETVDKLYDKNVIDIVTARDPSINNYTKKWLSDNSIKYDEFINLKEGNKSEHEMDILIDDYTGNIRGFLQKTEGYGILYCQPWNRGKVRSELQKQCDSDRLLIVKSWSQVPPIINYIKLKMKL